MSLTVLFVKQDRQRVPHRSPLAGDSDGEKDIWLNLKFINY